MSCKWKSQRPAVSSQPFRLQSPLLLHTRLQGLWRNGSASDSRSEGWEFESLCPHIDPRTSSAALTSPRRSPRQRVSIRAVRGRAWRRVASCRRPRGGAQPTAARLGHSRAQQTLPSWVGGEGEGGARTPRDGRDVAAGFAREVGSSVTAGAFLQRDGRRRANVVAARSRCQWRRERRAPLHGRPPIPACCAPRADRGARQRLRRFPAVEMTSIRIRGVNLELRNAEAGSKGPLA